MVSKSFGEECRDFLNAVETPYAQSGNSPPLDLLPIEFFAKIPQIDFISIRKSPLKTIEGEIAVEGLILRPEKWRINAQKAFGKTPIDLQVYNF